MMEWSFDTIVMIGWRRGYMHGTLMHTHCFGGLVIVMITVIRVACIVWIVVAEILVRSWERMN